MADLHTLLSAWWNATEAGPAKAKPGASAIQTIEQRYFVTLPDDFRAYLLETAPADDFWDVETVTWWSPSNLKNIPDETTHPIRNLSVEKRAQTYLFFADYLIGSSAWAICCDQGSDRGKIVSIDGGRDAFVAPSFTAFLGAYLADWTSVL